MSDEEGGVLKEKASEDLAAAKKLFEMPDFSEEIVLFHCQQAVEKRLKAFLSSKAVVFPKKHDLEVLLSLCIEKDASFEQLSDVTSFTPYAVEIRYDEKIEMPANEVKEIITKTEQAVNFILKVLKK